MDVLTSLKNAIKTKEKIVMEDGKDYLLFTNSGMKIPRKYPTRIQLKKGELVTIESLYTFYLYKGADLRDYNQAVYKGHLTMIGFTDKKKITDLLEGVISEYKFVSPEEFDTITKEAKEGTYVLSLAQTDASSTTATDATMETSANALSGVSSASSSLLDDTAAAAAAAATTTAGSSAISSGATIITTTTTTTTTAAASAIPPGAELAVGVASAAASATEYDACGTVARGGIEGVMEREVPLLKRAHFMCCSSADYSGISSKAARALSENNFKVAAKTLSLTKKDLQTPIIIIPDILSYPLSVTNVREFLENGMWKKATRKDPRVTSEVVTLKPSQAGSKRKLSGKFKVVDSVSTIDKEDWGRVVAAFVHGQAWQFKDWAWKTPIDVTHNIQTFAISVDKSPLKPTISQWKIPVLSVKLYIFYFILFIFQIIFIILILIF